MIYWFRIKKSARFGFRVGSLKGLRRSCVGVLLMFDGVHCLERKEQTNYTRTLYRHECEPVVQMLNTADRVVEWGVMPLLRGGLY